MTIITWTTLCVETLTFIILALTIYVWSIIYEACPSELRQTNWFLIICWCFTTLHGLLFAYGCSSFLDPKIVHLPAGDLGISYDRKIGDGTFITKIHNDSPLAGKVAVGYEILIINNTRISSLSIEQYEILTKDLHLQPCTLVLNPTRKKRTVQAPPNSLVLSSHQVESVGNGGKVTRIYVKSIPRDSQVCGELLVGDEISSINGTSCIGLTPERAQLLIDSVANSQCELIGFDEGYSANGHKRLLPFYVLFVCLISFFYGLFVVVIGSIASCILHSAMWIMCLSRILYQYVLWIR